MGNFNLNLVCFVVRPVALDVPVGGECSVFTLQFVLFSPCCGKYYSFKC